MLAIPWSYPLSPKHPYPAALEAVLAAYKWVRLESAARGIPSSDVVMVGESAGANLVVAVCLRLIEEGREDLLPAGLVLGYPVLHMVKSMSPSRTCNLSCPLLPFGVASCAIDSYTGVDGSKEKDQEAEARRHDHLVSPFLAPDWMLGRLPRTFLMAGGLDPLLDDTVDFAYRLGKVGVRCELRVYRTLPHGFWSLDLLLPEAAEAAKLVTKWVERLILRD